ncbi:MAG TPA: DUF3052 domain-containing protein [Actinomycetota bacterium]|nr:DUF3052 domain-containing protein [Actinomycetota bacterium]
MPAHEPSGTPLARKLGIRPGARVRLVGAPEGFTVEGLPADVDVRTRAGGRFDVVVLFTARRAELRRRFAPLAGSLRPDGGLWVCWPTKASGRPTDLSFAEVQAVGLGAGLVDNKSASIDPVFQGLRFVYRLRDRPPR